MQKIVFDTNVLLDVLLQREPHSGAAIEAIRRVEEGVIRGIIAATSLTTLYYYVRKTLGETDARLDIRDIARNFIVSQVDQGLVHAALARDGSDFEDDLIIETAIREGASVILTRDAFGFRRSPVPAVSPSEWLAGA